MTGVGRSGIRHTFLAQIAVTRLNCCQSLFLVCNNESGFFFSAKYMHCLSAHECCARRLLRTMNYVGVMYLCCQNQKHGRVGFRLKQRSAKSTLTRKNKKTNLSLASHYVMMRIFVGTLFYVQGDYFQCSTVSKILRLEHSYVRHTETCS